MTQISGEFVRMISVAGLVSAPLSYLFAKRWLNGFAYHIELTPIPFFASILAISFIAAATISIHTLRAASINPANALRRE